MVKMAMIHLTGTLTMAGGWVADNSDPTYLPAISPFIFSDAFPSSDEYLILGCFRPQNDPWYLQTPPAWTQLILVPLYSFFSSLVNLQPISNDGMKWDKTKGVYRRRRHNRQDFIAMIIIACISYGVHQWAYYCMPNYQNGVPLVGGLVLGILGNVYAFASNGTAFSVMATGVFLMLPVSFFFRVIQSALSERCSTIDWSRCVWRYRSQYRHYRYLDCHGAGYQWSDGGALLRGNALPGIRPLGTRWWVFFLSGGPGAAAILRLILFGMLLKFCIFKPLYFIEVCYLIIVYIFLVKFQVKPLVLIYRVNTTTIDTSI